MASITFQILGCGSSGGVPRLGGVWGACDPKNPKNDRQRCSLLITRQTANGKTSVLIDTTPDMRRQLLNAKVDNLDAVLYTHDHADHVHGLDDLRMLVLRNRKRLQLWADKQVQKSLNERFGYAFIQPQGSPYPPILDLNDLVGDLSITGDGGTIHIIPFYVKHGGINALGFRINNFAYLPDVSEIPEKSWRVLDNLDCWVVDALRYTPHPSHSHLSQTLEWINRANPKRAIITNMHIDLDYETVCAETPERVTAAYDGMKIQYDI
ncbi:MAG: MBL fold metallo-hydrolase [Rhodobacteraceae bacterium]|nr:MBL fold metallo-hydrolase [Paracoccaceae bacterium]